MLISPGRIGRIGQPTGPTGRVSRLQSLLEALYGNGEQGAFFVPKPQVLGQQVLFQDAAGTTPVTAPGDPVGLMLDLSGNDNHAMQEVSGSRPVYRTDGQYHWLEFDGVDDVLGCGPVITDTSYFMAGAASNAEGDSLAPILATSQDSGKSHVIYCDSRTSPRRLFRYSNSDDFIDRLEQYIIENPEVLSGMRDGPAAKGWIDGSVVGEVSSAVGGGDFSNLQIGHYGPFFARINFYGGVVLNYPGATEQHNAAHQYLANLAGVTLSD